jgi:hypothetical protein
MSSRDDKEASPRPQIREVQLQSFEVVLDPPPSFRQRVQECKRVISRGFQAIDKIFILILILNLTGVGIYQTINSYTRVYPGSNVTRLINGSWLGWTMGYWTLAVIAILINFLFIGRAVDYIYHLFRFHVILPRGPRVQTFLHMFLLFGVAMPLAVGPAWISFCVVPVWKNIAWDRVCRDWDMTVTLQGATWSQFQSNFTVVVGLALIQMRSSNYTMALFRNPAVPEFFAFQVVSTYNTVPPLSGISYNMTVNETSYTINNVSTPFDLVPNLSFPSLDVFLRNPKILFVQPDNPTYPPSADLIRNSSTTTNVLTTQLQNPKTCTELRVCGMEDQSGTFQIALGVVMIQQLNVSVSCT